MNLRAASPHRMPNATSNRPPQLVADVGATNARFALVNPPGAAPRDERTLRCADFPTLVAAVEHYLAQLGGVRPNAAAVAIANPVTGDHIKMTNHVWEFSIEQSRVALGLERLVVLNDFTALALSLPHIARGELHKVGGGEPAADAAIALIGAGTGLGVSGLIPIFDVGGAPSRGAGSGSWAPLRGEGGHVSLSPVDPREMEILKLVWRDYRHVSAERLLSGIGFENLYLAIAALEGQSVPPLTPAEITQRALAGGDPLCVNVVNTFCAMLGTVAGNLALTLGALGGLYIGGGIVPKLGVFFDNSPFRARFEDKGRFAQYMSAIPAYVILANNPALIGASRALAG
jgi:glucokinase